jgi:hypothetical protein
LYSLLLLNPSELNSATHDGLQAISLVVRRLGVMGGLIRPGDSSLAQNGYQSDSLDLVKDFEDTETELCKTIVEFQIRLVRLHFS